MFWTALAGTCLAGCGCFKDVKKFKGTYHETTELPGNSGCPDGGCNGMFPIVEAENIKVITKRKDDEIEIHYENNGRSFVEVWKIDERFVLPGPRPSQCQD